MVGNQERVGIFMNISRTWAMPSKDTFTIRPIKDLLHKYVGNGKNWIDPFAGNNSPAEFTNDLNPNTTAKSHIHAVEFVTNIPGPFNGVLFDPPYSPRQISEVYKSIGLPITSKDTQNALLYSKVKDIISSKLNPYGYAISFGWNSMGFGSNRGFEMIEILLVPHGAAHNDTIIVVERKI